MTNTLSRNLRKLTSALKDVQHDTNRLLASCAKDQDTKSTDGKVNLTPKEMGEYHGKLKAFMNTETQAVEIRPIELFNSKEGEKPRNPKLAIDTSMVKIPTVIYSALLDVVLFETENLPVEVDSRIAPEEKAATNA